VNSKCNPILSRCSISSSQDLLPTSSCESALSNRSNSPLSGTRVWRAAGCSMAGLLILLVAAVAMAPTPSSAAQLSVGVSIRIGPPPLPVYAQPVCPGPGYIWTPGYWAYDPVDGYYWVPGTWVMAPAPGLLWTPGYWGWSGGLFIWHAGYWGPHVGFYGGINYGFGYVGVGYVGGYWRGGSFFYNRAVNNVNVVHITNVYTRTVVNNVTVTRVSYNGGPGGLRARPTPAEMAAEHDRHIAATSVQQQHQNLARQNRAQFASVNHGRPNIVATARPGQFQGSSGGRPGGGQKFAPHGPNPPLHNNISRAQHPNPVGAGSHQYATANPPSSRNPERPQGRTPSVESRQAHIQASRGATPSHNAGGPHPQAEERRSNAPEGKKQGH
jgi:hypothetical protein